MCVLCNKAEPSEDCSALGVRNGIHYCYHPLPIWVVDYEENYDFPKIIEPSDCQNCDAFQHQTIYIP